MYWFFNGVTLISPFYQFWNAISGPHRNGRLPSGIYTIGQAVQLAKAPENVPYTDPSGNAWWCPLTPQFSTTRTKLGIHPDGNVFGTEGCIGIQGIYTLDCFNALSGQSGISIVVKFPV